MSCDFWGVLGRLTCDASFRRQAFERAKGGAVMMPEAEALYGYLTSQGYRLDRYHFMEVNRVLSTVLPGGEMAGAPGGPFDCIGREIDALCPLQSAGDDLHIILGVSYIDRPLRGELHLAAKSGDERAFADLLARPPGFRLAPINRAWLCRLFANPEVISSLERVNDWAWRVPIGTPPDDGACDAGLTLHSAYKHTSQVERRVLRLETSALRGQVQGPETGFHLPMAA